MRSFPVILLFLLTCCTQVLPPHVAMDRVNREFAGQDAGYFFADYGAASNVRRVKGGGKIYRWISLEASGGASSPDVFSYPGGTYSVPMDSTNGEIITGYCEVDIATDIDDHIRTITPVEDSLGKFSGSRCAEIFGQSGE